MSQGSGWTVEKIKEAYRDNLRLWNAVHPIHPDSRVSIEEIEADTFDYGDLKAGGEVLCRRAAEVIPQLKESADLSGNPQVWRKGEPLDGLSEGMVERIEKGLSFGI